MGAFENEERGFRTMCAILFVAGAVGLVAFGAMAADAWIAMEANPGFRDADGNTPEWFFYHKQQARILFACLALSLFAKLALAGGSGLAFERSARREPRTWRAAFAFGTVCLAASAATALAACCVMAAQCDLPGNLTVVVVVLGTTDFVAAPMWLGWAWGARRCGEQAGGDRGGAARKAAAAAAACAGMFALLCGGAFLAVCWMFMLGSSGSSEPTYYVDSYGELREDLAADCPDMRFFDLSRYEGLGCLTYRVDFMRNGWDQRLRGYSVYDTGGGDPDGRLCLGDCAREAGVDTSLRSLSFDCDDRRSFNGKPLELPDISPDMERGGVGIERSSWSTVVEDAEGARSRDALPAGSTYGCHGLRFVIGSCLYEVDVSYGVAPGASAEEVDAASDAALQEALGLACSVIDQ